MDVDSIDNIVGLFPRRFGLIAFDANCEGGVKLRNFPRDICFGRGPGCRVGDDRPHVLERGLPVVTQRDDIDEGPVDRTAYVILADACLQVAAPRPRPRFQPPIDHLQRQQVDQYLLVIHDRVINLFPRPGDDHRDEPGQGRFDDNPADIGNLLRLAEVRNGPALALALPLGKMLIEQLLEHGRITVACDNNHRLLRTIPALMEQLQHPGGCGTERFRRPDRRAVGQALAGEEQFPRGVLHDRLRTSPLAQFGQYDRTLRIYGGNAQSRGTHHARQDFQALVEARLGRIGQIQLVDGLRRRGFSIAVAAEGRAQALPDPFCLAVRDMGRAAEGQMLHEMGKSLFFLGLHQ